MGEIGARDDERPAPFQDLGQGGAEVVKEGRIRLTDDRWDDLCLRKKDLEEGNLDLDRMFVGVGRRVGLTVGVGRQERRDDLSVHRGGSQGGPEAAARVEGDLPEAGGRVVGAQDDDDVVGPVPDLAVAVGADLAGVDIAGMGDDDGERFPCLCRQGVLHEFFNGEPEDGR